jgi:hypothetical protein
VGFVVEKAALEQVSSEYFGFPLPSIPTIAVHATTSLIRGWYNSQ